MVLYTCCVQGVKRSVWNSDFVEPNVIKSGSHTSVAKLSAGLNLEKLNVKCVQILLT